MDDHKIKVDIKTDKDELTIRHGNDLYRLEDESYGVFKTTCIEDFVKYVSANITEYSVFYGCQSAYVFKNDISYNRKCIAELLVDESVGLKRVRGLLDRNFTLDTLEKRLRSLKPWFGDGCRELLLCCRDLTIEKIQKITRQKDNRGNFVFSAVRKGTSDTVPYPEDIKFEVPIFDMCNIENVLIALDVGFDFDEKKKDDVVTYEPYFYFECPLFGELINDARKQAMRRLLGGLVNVEYGSFRIENQTNAWSFKKNTYETR